MPRRIDLGRDWRRFWALGPFERSLLLRAALLLPLVALGLRLFPFRRVRAAVAGPAIRTAGRSADRQAQAAARLVDALANRLPGRPGCLPRALTLCRLLRRAGLDAELRIGVGKPDGRFTAHAWVVHAGRSLDEGESAAGPYLVLEPPSPRGFVAAP